MSTLKIIKLRKNNSVKHTSEKKLLLFYTNLSKKVKFEKGYYVPLTFVTCRRAASDNTGTTG